MFKKAKKIYIDIDENKLKSLKLFESADGNFNDLGYYITYTRIPGGVIRTIGNTEALDQMFIPLPASFFVIKD